jgi:predicted nucleotidyltransferase
LHIELTRGLGSYLCDRRLCETMVRWDKDPALSDNELVPRLPTCGAPSRRSSSAVTVYAVLSDEHSLWSVQVSLKALERLGLVRSRTVGRAGVHTINEEHAAIPPLRALVDPIHTLKEVIERAIDPKVQAVLLFGSIARGEATVDSDVDLAVIADHDWQGQVDLEDTVRSRLGNKCDVLAFTSTEFTELAHTGEPVVYDILRDGIALVGSKPRLRQGAA